VRRLEARELAAIGCGIACVAGVAVLLTVYAPRWWSGAGGTYAPAKLTVATAVQPGSALFADVVTYRAHVLLDRREFDPSTVRLDASFTPFRIVSEGRSTRRLGARTARVDFTIRVQCVTVDCLRDAGLTEKNGAVLSSPVALQPARVRVARRNGTTATAVVTWPTVVVHSRLTPDQIRTGTPAVGPFPTPSVSYAVAPDLAGALLLGAGVLFALAAGFLLASALRGKPVPLRLRLPSHLTPLERALALVEVAAREETPVESRKALERLAAELRRSGHPDLTDAAQRLAWSRDEPSPEAVEELVGDVSRSMNGG
jgi:hypothetical protein